jgi:hypothetical protein
MNIGPDSTTGSSLSQRGRYMGRDAESRVARRPTTRWFVLQNCRLLADESPVAVTARGPRSRQPGLSGD